MKKSRNIAALFRILICIYFVSLSMHLFSLPSDSEEPIEIEADFAELDDIKGVATYTGKVVVVQGSLRLLGDKLVVELTDEDEIKQAFLTGKPARFKQTPRLGEPDIEGEALEVEYFSEKEKIILKNKARVTQGERLTEGHRINYDVVNNIITIRSARANELKKHKFNKKDSQRVRIVIPSRNSSE